ncbi:MAG TPA: ABC transporter permease, partial [Vicinamibacterales bacterium]|nr:ABC transporter permease [Vicinamibacterales bacterium]
AFTADNERTGADQVVILSHDLWIRRFNADPDIVGRPLTFGKDTRVVVGVMPDGFTYPIGPEVATSAYIPHVPRANDRDHGFGGRSYYLDVVGRLRAGATLAQAQEQVARATDAVIAAHPTQTFWKDSRPLVTTLHERVVGPSQRWLVLLLGAVGFVLLIAYVNVANLLLARATARSRELAVRTALGAARSRVARMLVLESLMLSLGAALLGILLSIGGIAMAKASLPAGLARAATIALDLRVLGFAIGVAVVTGVVFGVVPAWYGSRADVISILKDGGSSVGAGRGRARWQRLLLVAELAFVVTLLTATSLFVMSFINVVRADLGFSRGNLYGVSVSRSLSAIAEPDRTDVAAAFTTELLERVTAIPGVAGAAFVNGGLPLFGAQASYSIEIPGYGQTTGADMIVMRSVTRNYFDVAGVPFVSGRTFDGGERTDTPHVMIINDEAARRFFGGRNPVGEVVRFRGPTTIVGVVKSVRMSGPETSLRPEMYVPLLQEAIGRLDGSITGDVVVRVASPSPATLTAIQTAVAGQVNSGRPTTVRSVDDRFRELTADRRFNAGLMALFGALALVIAALGVYGLTSFLVAQQSRPIGLRIALGATTQRIFTSVLTDTGRLLAIGVLLGLFGAWAMSRLFASVVFGVEGREGWLYATVALTLGIVCLLAAWLPARRASRVDPLIVLRE